MRSYLIFGQCTRFVGHHILNLTKLLWNVERSELVCLISQLFFGISPPSRLPALQTLVHLLVVHVRVLRN